MIEDLQVSRINRKLEAKRVAKDSLQNTTESFNEVNVTEDTAPHGRENIQAISGDDGGGS